MDIAFDARGLVPAIVQDRLTGQVRMLAYMSRASLERTLQTGRATFFSRSRGELWEKGATSGNGLCVASIHADCDADALLILADPLGPTCHTGSPSCFFRRVTADDEAPLTASAAPRLAPPSEDATALLEALEREIHARKTAPAAASYTRTLLDGGAARIGDKLREEADELARAVADESEARVAAEAADLVYHALVALASRGVTLRDVLATLAARQGTSGLEEKARRGR